MDINLQSSAEEGQLLRCQAWILTLARFIPGLFADRADKEQVPAGFQCRHRILLEQMAQTNFMIIEVAGYAQVVEIERFIWYHVVRPFSPGWEKTNEAVHPGRCTALSRLIEIGRAESVL